MRMIQCSGFAKASPAATIEAFEESTILLRHDSKLLYAVGIQQSTRRQLI